MEASRAKLVGLVMVLGAFASVAVLYGRLPDPIPTHWNSDDVADGFMAKPWGALLLPLVMAGVYALFLVLPRISPLGYEIERFSRAFGIMQNAVLAFLLMMNVMTLLVASGVDIQLSRVAYAGVGILFVVLGNFFGKVTRNFFVGIRTPWTLASEEVWLRTHRLGGKCFVAAGLFLVAASLLGTGVAGLFAAVGFAAVVPVVYSYVLYRKLGESRP